MKKPKHKIVTILLILLTIIVFVALWRFIDFSQIADISYIQETVRSFGILAPIIYMLIMAIAIIVSPIPSMPLTAASGVIWGPYLGAFYSVIGAEIGAIISFLIARQLGRIIIERMLHKHINFCNKCTEKNITVIVLIARLFPFFQFDIISYGAGLTNIKLSNFAWATFIGMIPMALVFAFFGQSFFIGTTFTIIFSVALIILIFIVPIGISKYNLFGLRKTINIK